MCLDVLDARGAWKSGRSFAVSPPAQSAMEFHCIVLPIAMVGVGNADRGRVKAEQPNGNQHQKGANNNPRK